jgi:hypothetical protein
MDMKRMWAGFVACIAVLGLEGCAASSGGFPKRSGNEKADMKALESKYAQADTLAAYYEIQDEPTKQVKRDEIVNGRMALVDANYKVFVREFVAEKESLDTATDATVIGLNTWGALIVPTNTTRILSGISAGLVGAKSSYDKNFYYEQTVKALYNTMNAARKEVRVRILDGLTKPVQAYPIAQALSDLDDYYYAGTFLGALQTIQRDAGASETQSQAKLDTIRRKISERTPDQVGKQLEAIHDAVEGKVLNLTTDKCKALVLAIDPNAPVSAIASPQATHDWLVDRMRGSYTPEGGRDKAKIEKMHKAMVDQGLITS